MYEEMNNKELISEEKPATAQYPVSPARKARVSWILYLYGEPEGKTVQIK